MPNKRVVAASAAICFAIIAVLSFVASTGSAGAATDPCEIVDRAVVARLLGPTSTPEVIAVETRPACRYSIGGLTLDVVRSADGVDEFRRQHDAHAAASRREIEDYVDDAFFGWGTREAFDLVARRGDDVVVVRLTGIDPATGFDSGDPTQRAPGGDVAGSRAGSAMWVLMTKSFARLSDAEAPTVDDLSGLWRTNDITPCRPASDVSTRISRITAGGASIRAVKVAGDSCLLNSRTDFEGTTTGQVGEGLAFGLGTGAPIAGIPYRLSVVGPERLRLTGRSGALRYTLDYERLSWPGLDQPRSVLLGIPSPSQALTAKNVALATALSVVLFGLVVFPTTLFNSTLEANLDQYARLWAGLWGRLRLSGHHAGAPSPESGSDGATVEGTHGPPTSSAGGRSLWQRPAGVALYLVGSGVLYSLMQPGWGLNAATLITFIGFVASLVATSAIGVLATRIYYGFRYRDGGGRPAIEGSTLGVAAVSVAASRAGRVRARLPVRSGRGLDA